MSFPIYFYDLREQFVRPVFVVYDEAHVEPIVRALYGAAQPSFLYRSSVRMHRTEANDPYATVVTKTKKRGY